MLNNLRVNNNLTKISLLVIFAIWGTLAAVFGIYDLEISLLFYNRDSIWGNIGADFGESPGFCILVISVGILFGSVFTNKHKQKIPFYILILIFLGFLIYYLVVGVYNSIHNPIAIIIVSIIFLSIFYRKNLKEYRNLAWVILLLGIFNPLFFVQLMKLFTQRVRFRNLLDIGLDNFSNWYDSIGVNTEHNSFPSGHTAMGWMLLPLLIPTRKLEWKNPLKILTILVVFSLGFFVGLSRIKVGAHFASDVLFSSGAAFVYTTILYQWFYSTETKTKESSEITVDV